MAKAPQDSKTVSSAAKTIQLRSSITILQLSKIHIMTKIHPRINSSLFEFGSSIRTNLGIAMMKVIKTYQPASITVAVKTIIDLASKDEVSPKN